MQKRGWAGLKNGILLASASAEFDVFITADANLEFQQNLASLPIAVIILIAVNNRMATLRGLVPEVLTVLGTIKPGELVRVGSL